MRSETKKAISDRRKVTVELTVKECRQLFKYLGAYADHLAPSAEWVSEISGVRYEAVVLREKFRGLI